MFNTEHLQEKWQPVLEHPDLPEIKDPYRRAVTTVILENQERAMGEDREFLGEVAPNNATGASIQNWDPILISLVRRAMPSLIAYDICGVQPMTGPTGLIFAMKARYTSQLGPEALYNEANTFFGAQKQNATTGAQVSTQTGSDVIKAMSASVYSASGGMTTAAAEALGDSNADSFAQMAFSIEKATVTARSRALKAEYTMELAQDLKAIHGLDAETELANILSAEILAEINREVIRTIYLKSVMGAATNTSTAGIFDLNTDSNGRWSVEKFKGLMFSMERDANMIARDTRRGKGNILICSADVASAMTMAGLLDYQSALQDNLNVDSTGNTFAGVLNGRLKVYVDPYANMSVPYPTAGTPAGASANQYYVVGYKGTSPYDAGLFYCPYVPLQMVRAVGENTFQPKIGFKTRYGLIANPFAESTVVSTSGTANANVYYRRAQITNLM
jgi:hypothetical protein|tara:strand:- start:3340 stop:4680 length:1341 start_codon:yes stop_codon:yes gene_type:complete